MQGGGRMFPNYLAGPKGEPGRLADAFEATLDGKATRGRPIGTFSAAWDDTGLHNELFWLGWAAMAQCSWTPGGCQPHQTAADFMDIYYGRETTDMTDVYRDLQSGSAFWESAWDRVVSTERPPAYGNSDRKFPFPRHDLTLQPPALPTLPDLAFTPQFRTRYPHLLAQLPQRFAESDRLICALQTNMTRALRNRYNLHVLLTVAHQQRHFLELLSAMDRIEGLLTDAGSAHAAGEPDRAVKLLARAHATAGWIIADLDGMYRRLKSVWEVSRFEKGRSVGGRQFVHIMDDVKDHSADRRADLSYLIMNEQRIGLPAWRDRLGEIIRDYSKSAGVRAAIDSPHE